MRKRSRQAGSGSNDVSDAAVMARRSSIAACVTCGLCGGFLRDATAISECLHAFCRKCISEKFKDEDNKRCPTCNIDLGCDPKLRADRSLQCISSAMSAQAAAFAAERTEEDAPSHIPSRRRLCSSHEDQFARPKVLEPEVSSTIPEEPPATDLLLSAGMQIAVPLQDLQGESADVVPAPPAPCFKLMQSKQKSVSIAATSPITRPSDNVSASEAKMPEDLPTLVEQEAVAESVGELLNKVLDLQKQIQFRLLKKNSALVARAESAEAKLAEQEECSAKLRTCHLAALAVLKEHILSLEKENTKILSSLKEHAQTENILKEQLTNQVDRCKYAKNQLCQAQQREAELIRELDLAKNVCNEAYSQLFTGIQEIQMLNTSLDKAEAEKEEIKVAATPILKLVSRLSENQASAPFLDQLREVPRLIREYVRSSTSRVLGTVRAYFPDLDLTRVGEGKPKDCSAESFASHIAAMEPVAYSLIESFTL